MSGTHTIKNRIKKPWGRLWALRQWLLNSSIPVGQRMSLWRRAVDSTMLWGSASWTVTDGVKQFLVSMEHAMHRRILHLPRRPDETCWRYRSRCSRIFAQWLRDTNGITIFQKSLRKIWTWAGHVARLPASRIVRCAMEFESLHWLYATRVVGGEGHRRGGAVRRWENKLDKLCLRQWNQTRAITHAVHTK
jgi:phage tail protein X